MRAAAGKLKLQDPNDPNDRGRGVLRMDGTAAKRPRV